MTENLDNLPDTARKARKALKKLQESKKPKFEYLLKICIIGTNFKLRDKLIRSYAEDYSDDRTHETTGVNISTHKVSIDNTHIKLILVNIAGQEFFGKLRPNYYRGASACIIVFDKSDRRSFDTVPDWLKEFQTHILSPDIPIAIVGINTKSKNVSNEEGNALADQLDLAYFETSYPKFRNAQEIFQYLARKVIKL